MRVDEKKVIRYERGAEGQRRRGRSKVASGQTLATWGWAVCDEQLKVDADASHKAPRAGEKKEREE